MMSIILSLLLIMLIPMKTMVDTMVLEEVLPSLMGLEPVSEKKMALEEDLEIRKYDGVEKRVMHL